MEKIYPARLWDGFAYIVLSTIVLLLVTDIYILFVLGDPLDSMKELFLIELCLFSMLIFVKIMLYSQTMILNDHGIVMHLWCFKLHKHTIEWKDIKRIKGPFSCFLIGERVVVYCSRGLFSRFDLFKPRRRMHITNSYQNFESLVVDIVKHATSATVAENVKEYVAKHRHAEI